MKAYRAKAKLVGKHLDMFYHINMLSEAGQVRVGTKSRELCEARNGRVYDPILGRFLGVDKLICSSAVLSSISTSLDPINTRQSGH